MGSKRKILTIGTALDVISGKIPGIRPSEVLSVVNQLQMKAPSQLSLSSDPLTTIVACLLHQRYYLNYHPSLSVAPILLVDGTTQPNMAMLQKLAHFSYCMSAIGIFEYPLDPTAWENRSYYFCPKRAHDLMVQLPTAKPATRTQIHTVKALGNPLLVKSCPPSLRWKINVRNCQLDCKFRSQCRYRQFNQSIREGKHKIIVGSRHRLSRELQFASVSNKPSLPDLGYIIFPSAQSFKELPLSGSHRTELQEREIHALLDRCEMSLRPNLESKAHNEKLLGAIRESTEQLYAYARSEGPGCPQHPEKVQTMLQCLGNALDCFIHSKTYPFRDQPKLNTSMLRSHGQIKALQNAGIIRAEIPDSGAVTLIGRSLVNLILPRNARVIIAHSNNI